ncbi:unannotated protein [freshwater metagenome]|uniref:Unannotated protein n=1 Tax=freshwater metagenome TaxID=449393 RepID=A0A6J7HT71_9ZZZZ|nr:carboxymuconolactone decarboxylase [Actinomycetota bacterium]
MPQISRFPLHDELSAPDGSLPVLRGVLSTADRVPNFIGVLAGSPAALRGYARLWAELHHGSLDAGTLERIAVAVAEHHGSGRGVVLHGQPVRDVGLTPDEVGAARQFSSALPEQAALLRLLEVIVTRPGPPPEHLLEEARDLGWTDEQLLEAIAVVALETFTALVTVAGDVPVDASGEAARLITA